MIPFVVVKTRGGFAYIRPEHVVAINATDSTDCTVLLTDGVTIAASESAEDVVARLEAEADDEDKARRMKEKAESMKEHIRHGHVDERD